MAYDCFIFANPIDRTTPVLRLDSGVTIPSTPATHPDNGAPCQLVVVPEGTPNKNGASYTFTAPDYYEQSYHGFLYLDEPTKGRAALLIDIFNLIPVPPPPATGGGGGTEPPTPPAMPTDPLGIINQVYATGLYDLRTHQGCGEFTEACALQLYQHNFPLWGHIKKTGAQNQYNGHAVDAVQCLGGVETGIWDIIFSSVSPEAKPAYNYKGPADPSLWLPPDGAPSRLLQSLLVVHP